jgi:hypothetical protein
MRTLMNIRTKAGAAIGTLAVGVMLTLPAFDAAQAAGARHAAAGGPVEMQRGGFRGGGFGGGFRGGGFRPGVGVGGWRGGGWRGGGWYGGGWNNAWPWVGAAAAGLIIGGAAAAASSPYYYGGYGYGYGGCWIERRWVQRWDGALVPRNVRVCH